MYHFRLKWKRYTVCTKWWDSNFFWVGLLLFPVGLLLFARWESWTPVFKILVRALTSIPKSYVAFICIPRTYIALTSIPKSYVAFICIPRTYIALRGIRKSYVTFICIPRTYIALTSISKSYVAFICIPRTYIYCLNRYPKVLLGIYLHPNDQYCLNYSISKSCRCGIYLHPKDLYSLNRCPKVLCGIYLHPKDLYCLNCELEQQNLPACLPQALWLKLAFSAKDILNLKCPKLVNSKENRCCGVSSGGYSTWPVFRELWVWVAKSTCLSVWLPVCLSQTYVALAQNMICSE